MKIFFIIYLIGYVIVLALSLISLIPRLFLFNSKLQKNMRLLCQRIDMVGRIDDFDGPSYCTYEPNFKSTLREFGFYLFFCFLNSLLSWIQVMITIGIYMIEVYQWVCLPSTVRKYRWQIRNIVFPRAEDLLKLSQEAGVATKSDKLIQKEIEKISFRSY